MSSLLLYLDSLNDNKMDVMKRICTTLLQIFKDHASISRVTLPVMNTFDRLLSSGKFDAIVGDPETEYAEHLFELVKQEISKCSDMNKIISGTAVLCDLVVCAAHYRLQILSYLSIMLCHRYPRIRRDVASKLFTAVVSFDGIVSEESLDEITVLLTETDWGDSVEIVRPIRNQLCDHLKISRPKQIKK